MVQQGIQAKVNGSSPKSSGVEAPIASNVFTSESGAESVLPEAFRDEDVQKRLQQHVVSAFDAWTNESVNQRLNWQRAIQTRSNIKKDVPLPFEGAIRRNIPYAGPKVEQRKVSLVSAVATQDPGIFQFKPVVPADAESASRVSTAIDVILKSNGFKDIFTKAADLAMCCNAAIFRTTFQTQEVPPEYCAITGPVKLPMVETISPMNFFIYPTFVDSIQKALIVGHFFNQRWAEVKALSKKGVYLPVPDNLPNDLNGSPNDGQVTLVSYSGTQSSPEGNMKIFDCVVKFDADQDGIEEIYRVITSRDLATPLRVEVYPYPRIWYSLMSVEREPGTLFPASSPLLDIIDIEYAIEDAANWMIWATHVNAIPPLAGVGMVANEKINKITPGNVVALGAVKDVIKLPTGMDPQGLPTLITLLRQLGDIASKTPDTIAGGPANNREVTATENEIKLMGYRLAGMDDLEQITPALVSIANMILILLKTHWVQFVEMFGANMPGGLMIEDVQKPYFIELLGSSPNTNPKVLAEEASRLFGTMLQIQPQAAEVFGSVAPGWVAELMRSIVRGSNLVEKDALIQQLDASMDAQAQAQQPMPLPQPPQEPMLSPGFASGIGIGQPEEANPEEPM